MDGGYWEVCSQMTEPAVTVPVLKGASVLLK